MGTLVSVTFVIFPPTTLRFIIPIPYFVHSQTNRISTSIACSVLLLYLQQVCINCIFILAYLFSFSVLIFIYPLFGSYVVSVTYSASSFSSLSNCICSHMFVQLICHQVFWIFSLNEKFFVYTVGFLLLLLLLISGFAGFYDYFCLFFFGIYTSYCVSVVNLRYKFRIF